MSSDSIRHDTLSERDIAMLAKCYITRELAAQADIHRVDSQTGATLVGRSGKGDFAGLAFPYRLPGDSNVREFRLRRDTPELERKSDGTVHEKAKYLSPPGRGNKFYFAPDTRACDLKYSDLPVVFTEGEKKCLALSLLARHEASTWRFLPIGLSGVWSWRGTVGKDFDAKGARRDVKGAVADFDLLAWKARTVYILFDANVRNNDSVRAARRCLAEELRDRGAIVRFVELPEDFSGNGIDDLLYERGPDAALSLFYIADEQSEADLDSRTRASISTTYAALNSLLNVAGIDASLHKGITVLLDKSKGVQPGKWVKFSDGEAGALLPGDTDVADSSKAKRWKRFWDAFETEQERIGKRLAYRIPGRTIKEGKGDRLRFISSQYQTPLIQVIADIKRRAKDLTGNRPRRFKAAALAVYAELPTYDPPDAKIHIGRDTNSRQKKNRKRDRFLRAVREIMEEFLPYGEQVLEATIGELHAEIETLAADMRDRTTRLKD